jgi:hypothetical protein
MFSKNVESLQTGYPSPPVTLYSPCGCMLSWAWGYGGGSLYNCVSHKLHIFVQYCLRLSVV